MCQDIIEKNLLHINKNCPEGTKNEENAGKNEEREWERVKNCNICVTSN